MSNYPDFTSFRDARKYCAERGLLGKIHLENPSNGRVVIIDKPKPEPPKPPAKKKPADD